MTSLVAHSEAGGVHEFRVHVPADSAFFEGHFSGHPILPGVAHLELARRAVRDVLGAGVWLARVELWRFRAPVGPGEELALRLEIATAKDTARVTLVRGATLVSAGTVVVASGVAPPDLGAAGQVAGAPCSGWDDASPASLPQRPPSRLITAVRNADAGGADAVGRVPRESPFALETDEFPAVLLVEMGAQAAAICEARALVADGPPGRTVPPPPAGTIVRLRDVRLATDVLPIDAVFDVRARLVREAGPLRTWSVAVELEGHRKVRAEVHTFQGDGT